MGLLMISKGVTLHVVFKQSLIITQRRQNHKAKVRFQRLKCANSSPLSPDPPTCSLPNRNVWRHQCDRHTTEKK